MIDPAVASDAEAFRRRFPDRAPYRALRPDASHHCAAAIDGLCYSLRYRSDWTDNERRFVRGAAAHLAEFFYHCWKTFHADVRVGDGPGGAECVATIKSGWLRSSTYHLPVERAVTEILQKPQSPFPTLGRQFVMADDTTNLLALFGLGAALGMSPQGAGEWADKFPGDLQHHIDAAVPHLARAAAAHFHALHPEGPPGAGPADARLYEHQLVWPPAGYHGDYCSSVAAAGVRAYEAGRGARLTVEDLTKLTRLPDDTITGGAAVVLLSRLTHDAPRGFAEYCFEHFARSAAGYRAVALEQAAAEGRDVDWMKTGDRPRYLLERRLHLLPLLYLDLDRCVDGPLRPLAEALVAMDFEKADTLAAEAGDADPDVLFHRVMLVKVRGQYAEAQQGFEDIARRFPAYAEPNYLGEFGMNCLNLGDAERAAGLLRRAADGESGFAAAASNVGWALMRAGRWDAALEAIAPAVQSPDRCVTALLNRAAVYEKLGATDKAAADRDEARMIRPFDRRCVAGYGAELMR